MKHAQQNITAEPDTLMRQAPTTVELYLKEVIEMVDVNFGKGYARANPALVASLVETCAKDYSTAMLSACIQNYLVPVLAKRPSILS